MQWACNTADARLRMVAGYRQNGHKKIAKSIAATCGAGDVSFYPPSARFWDATSSTGGRWWKYMFQSLTLPNGTETAGITSTPATNSQSTGEKMAVSRLW